MTTYKGVRVEGMASVFKIEDTRSGHLITAPSEAVRNHSPTGFEWGYGGSGPAQLALALLLDATNGDAVSAERMHQDFKWQCVALMPTNGWEVTAKEIEDWCRGVLPDRYFENKFKPLHEAA